MIVQPSAMQRVAAALPARAEPRQAESSVASPASVAAGAGKLRYAALTPEMAAVLRLERALEATYPQNGNRASKILDGLDAWRKSAARQRGEA